MLMLAIPMLILFAISEVICRVSDRVRGRGANRTDQWADNEVSPL
jgi:sec-independent protein translocase protein TatC